MSKPVEIPMPGVLDVAREFFRLAKAESHEDLTAKKLQKLVYYAQAHSLYARGRQMFREQVKAWEEGPVVPELFHETKGYRKIPFSHERLNEAAELSEGDRELIHSVWERYKHLSGDELGERTHGTAWEFARSRARFWNNSPPLDDDAIRREIAAERAAEAEKFEAFMSGLERGV